MQVRKTSQSEYYKKINLTKEFYINFFNELFVIDSKESTLMMVAIDY